MAQNRWEKEQNEHEAYSSLLQEGANKMADSKSWKDFKKELMKDWSFSKKLRHRVSVWFEGRILAIEIWWNKRRSK